jgi:hypothetical protein
LLAPQRAFFACGSMEGLSFSFVLAASPPKRTKIRVSSALPEPALSVVEWGEKKHLRSPPRKSCRLLDDSGRQSRPESSSNALDAAASGFAAQYPDVARQIARQTLQHFQCRERTFW